MRAIPAQRSDVFAHAGLMYVEGEGQWAYFFRQSYRCTYAGCSLPRPEASAIAGTFTCITKF